MVDGTKIIYDVAPTGHFKELYAKKNMVLGAHNLLESDELVLTIDHIEADVEIKTGRREDPTALINLIHFEGGKAQPMAMNISNATIIASLYGEQHVKWKGKAIQIHRAMVKNPGGKGKVPGLCVRKLIPDVGEDFAEHEDKIKEATNLKELRAAFLATPKHLQSKVTNLTNERKAELA
jgi:hypothetical protein